MAEDNKIQLKLELDENSVKSSFKQVETEAEKSGKSSSESFASGFKSATAGVTGVYASIAATITAALGAVSFGKAISEAIEAERAATTLKVAFRNVGEDALLASSRFSEFSKALSEQKGIDDDVINKNAAILVSIGRLRGEGLERATKAAIDLSKGLQIDVGGAFDLVAKAAAGNTGALGRYGIKVDESIPKNARFAEVLKLVERNFGGISQAIADNTFEGSLNKLSVSFTNLLESLGKLFTQSPVVRETLKIISEAFISLGNAVEKIGKTDVVGGLIINLAEVARIVNNFVSPAIEAFINLFVLGAKTVKLGLDALVVAVVGFGKLLVEAIVFPLRDIALLGGKLVSVFNNDVGQKLKDSIVGLSVNLTKPLQDEFSKATQIMSDDFESAAKSADEAFNTKTSQAIDKFLADYIARVSQAKEINSSLGDSFKQTANDAINGFTSLGQAFSFVSIGISESAKDLAINAEQNFKNMGKSMLQGVGQAAGQAFAAFGKAVQQGKDALSAFGEALLAAFGNSLVQLGTGFILQGIAQSLAGFGSGAPLIAAGAALAAFGGLLSASVGGGAAAAGGASAGAGGTGGGIATSPSDISNISQPQNPVASPGTTIAVNIQGNVLDRRQTGLELVDVISEAFQTQGVTILGAT